MAEFEPNEAAMDVIGSAIAHCKDDGIDPLDIAEVMMFYAAVLYRQEGRANEWKNALQKGLVLLRAMESEPSGRVN